MKHSSVGNRVKVKMRSKVWQLLNISFGRLPNGLMLTSMSGLRTAKSQNEKQGLAIAEYQFRTAAKRSDANVNVRT